MAKLSSINKNERRKKLVKKYEDWRGVPVPVCEPSEDEASDHVADENRSQTDELPHPH